MRASVQCGLDEIARQHAPRPDDGWILIPADHPLLVSQVLDQMIAEWERRAPLILVPTHAGRRGHPTLFRWALADAVRALPNDCGLNRLVHDREAEVCEVAVADRAVLCDLDTPDDYDELLKHTGDPPA
jgi:CTP:molybdopterin cytidylyltransferase MocA